MTQKQFLEKMVDLLDCEQEITMKTDLDTIEEWDSLSFVSFLAMAKVSYGKQISSADVKTAKTIHDLYELIK